LIKNGPPPPKEKQEYGIEESVTVIGGDYAADPIGRGDDLIYAKATLNYFKTI
jgi:hypothetical protein